MLDGPVARALIIGRLKKGAALTARVSAAGRLRDARGSSIAPTGPSPALLNRGRPYADCTTTPSRAGDQRARISCWEERSYVYRINRVIVSCLSYATAMHLATY